MKLYQIYVANMFIKQFSCKRPSSRYLRICKLYSLYQHCHCNRKNGYKLKGMWYYFNKIVLTK